MARACAVAQVDVRTQFCTSVGDQCVVGRAPTDEPAGIRRLQRNTISTANRATGTPSSSPGWSHPIERSPQGDTRVVSRQFKPASADISMTMTGNALPTLQE